MKSIKKQLEKYIKNSDFDNFYINVLKNACRNIDAARELNNLIYSSYSAFHHINDENKSSKILKFIDYAIVNTKIKNLDYDFVCLHHGIYYYYIKKNISSAREYLLMSANKNNHFAQYFLCLIDYYFYGDINSSLNYLSRAIINGNEAALAKYYSFIATSKKYGHVSIQNFNKINQLVIELNSIKKD